MLTMNDWKAEGEVHIAWGIFKEKGGGELELETWELDEGGYEYFSSMFHVILHVIFCVFKHS